MVFSILLSPCITGQESLDLSVGRSVGESGEWAVGLVRFPFRGSFPLG